MDSKEAIRTLTHLVKWVSQYGMPVYLSDSEMEAIRVLIKQDQEELRPLCPRCNGTGATGDGTPCCEEGQ